MLEPEGGGTDTIQSPAVARGLALDGALWRRLGTTWKASHRDAVLQTRAPPWAKPDWGPPPGQGFAPMKDPGGGGTYERPNPGGDKVFAEPRPRASPPCRTLQPPATYGGRGPTGTSPGGFGWRWTKCGSRISTTWVGRSLTCTKYWHGEGTLVDPTYSGGSMEEVGKFNHSIRLC